jgi:glycosyltransferase involved in cell wall biosynthesis
MLYQGASLFIYPSLFEGFGIPIIEALYSGTPVITSTGGCFGEAGGEGSIYINPQNPDELSAQIYRVLSDEALQCKMIEKGKEYVGRFSDQGIAENYMRLYRTMTSQEV